MDGAEESHQLAKCIKGRSRMTLCAAMVYFNGLMVVCTTVHSRAARRTVKVSTCGQTASSMKANLKMTTAMASAPSTTQTAKSMRVYGKMGRSTGKDSTFGRMAQGIFVFMLMVKRRNKESSKVHKFLSNNLKAHMATFKRDQQTQKSTSISLSKTLLKHNSATESPMLEFPQVKNEINI